jgi:hypothetical protein
VLDDIVDVADLTQLLRWIVNTQALAGKSGRAGQVAVMWGSSLFRLAEYHRKVSLNQIGLLRVSLACLNMEMRNYQAGQKASYLIFPNETILAFG